MLFCWGVFSLTIIIYLPSPPPQTPLSLAITTLLCMSMSFFSSFFFFFIQTLPCSNPGTLLAGSLFSMSVSILLVSSFCSLESTYDWNRMLPVFLWLGLFRFAWWLFWPPIGQPLFHRYPCCVSARYSAPSDRWYQRLSSHSHGCGYRPLMFSQSHV